MINATGPFADQLRRKADPSAQPIIAPSQGIHLVFDRSFLAGENAIMVPHTSDGRVMFAIPWHGHTVVGTTDTPIAEATLEPARWSRKSSSSCKPRLSISRRSRRATMFSASSRAFARWCAQARAAIPPRFRAITPSASRIPALITICGGKWTTYRHMAEDCVNQAATLARLPERPCVTDHLNIHGFHPATEKFGRLWMYGSDAALVRNIEESDPELAQPLAGGLPYTGAEVIWAVRHEWARTLEDVLARRTRALFLNARAALQAAPQAAELMARELNRDAAWQSGQLRRFRQTAENYLPFYPAAGNDPTCS